MPEQTDSRIRELERQAAVHDEQIRTHRDALTELTDNLKEMLHRVDRFEKMFVLGCFVIFAGTANGSRALDVAMKFLGL